MVTTKKGILHGETGIVVKDDYPLDGDFTQLLLRKMYGAGRGSERRETSG